jgi:hypothetical protein
MSWKTECIGRVLIQMPTDRPRSWSAQIDVGSVRRLQRPLSLNEFWAGVEHVRDAYAKQTHRRQPTRLGHYERMDAQRAAVVIGYDSPNSFFAPRFLRFLHLGEQHAYEFDRTLDHGNTPPSPELFKPYIEQYSGVFGRMRALREGEIPTEAGLCIDGALVQGETGRNARAGINVEIAHGTRLGFGYVENNFRVSLESAFEMLKRDQNRAEYGLTFTKEPLGYKEFKVLRRQERSLGGLQGQEFITRTTLNNGHTYYGFMWGTKGAEGGLLTPTISVHLNTPPTSDSNDGKPYASLPPEAELIELWDSVLATFRLRPGALPAGQGIRAVN